jgi:DNA polymerase III alpha subunit
MWTENNTLDELVKGVMRHGPTVLDLCQTSEDLSTYRNLLQKEHLNYSNPTTQVDHQHWFIPIDYCPNLVEYLYGCCETQEQTDRVSLELELFIKHGMYDVLYVMKYIVDTLRENNVLWGVGRGSSVSSYVLFLIGIHKIDSVKYNLPIEEFFKGEK